MRGGRGPRGGERQRVQHLGVLHLSCTSTYTWASIHTAIIFKTSTEVLYIVLHTSSRNTQSCLVCRLKGKALLLPYLYGEERPNIVLVRPVAHHPAAPVCPFFLGFLAGNTLVYKFHADRSLRRPTAKIRFDYPEFSRH